MFHFLTLFSIVVISTTLASMPISVRNAESSDLDWLIVQLKAFSAFHGSKRPLFGTEEYSRKAMTDMMTSHLVLIAERDDGERMGFVSGLVTPHFMNPEINTLIETFWWVPETHRNSRAGLMLLDAFVAFGKANADWISFTLEHHSPVSDRCLTRRGFDLKERSYLLEVG